MLFIAGDQLPEIALFEIVGNADNAAPEQIAETGLNVGIILGFTTIVNMPFVAHCPTVGVNVSVTAGAILFVKVSFCLMRQTTSTSTLSITLENRRCSPFSVAAWRILKLEGVTTVVKADIGIPAGAISRIDAGAALNKSGASFIHLI